MSWILFGAGDYGRRALKILGKENIEFFVDNNVEKKGEVIEGIEVRLFNDVSDSLKDYCIVVTASSKNSADIIAQLEESGITKYLSFNDLSARVIRERILKRPNYLDMYKRAINWTIINSVFGEGICVSSAYRKSYPEVSGYFIPTLLQWGYRDQAVQYARWLCDIQRDDGSWADADNKEAYIFDSAQVLKGLLAIRELFVEADISIIKGCNWLLSRMNSEGRLVTPDKKAWGDNRDICDEIVHIYCLSPLFEAGKVYGNDDYIRKANKIKEYYINSYSEKIMNFSLLSHFYAYVMEALVDIGEKDIAKEAMDRIAAYQDESGAVPAYNNVHWVCSTGLFQLALVWFKLGNLARGNRAFEYACRLQNSSGGWFGSYLSGNHPEEDNDYFPEAEISWANKYFLDALYYKNVCEFEKCSDIFLPFIDKDDGRYCLVRDEVLGCTLAGASILDAGCGKGRYLKNLLDDVPDRKYCAMDLSESVMKYINDDRVQSRQGILTCIPWEDNSFDLTYCCEALEHSIDIENAIRELIRVTKSGGRIVIIDKPIDKLGVMEIGEWEQWIDTEVVFDVMSRNNCHAEVIKEISYEGGRMDGLFNAWIGTVE